MTGAFSERSRLAITSPSITTGPWMLPVLCGCAGNTWTGCEPAEKSAFGLTATRTVNGLSQLVPSNVTVGGLLPDPALNRPGSKPLGSAETSVFPSSSRLTTTGAVGGLVSCRV